jgi:ribose 5-phosphate isomerase RpiB
MGARVIAPEAAEKVLDHWLTAEFEPGPSSTKVAKLEALDAKYHPAAAGRDEA